MTASITQTPSPAQRPRRAFEPGTTGWTIHDLMADPETEAQWQQGRFEIVEGVLTSMAPAFPFGNRRLSRLVWMIQYHLHNTGGLGEFGQEVDVFMTDDRVARVDAIFFTPDDDRRQVEELVSRGITERERVVQYAPPTLVIESVSEGHERHDRVIKRRWYAERGVPNYWILHTFERSLECLVLDGASYRTDQAGRNEDELRPSLFPGLVIPLSDLWK